MTDDEKRFLERLKAGDQPAWFSFAQVIQPVILDKLKRAIDDQETRLDVASEILVALVANIRKVAIDPAAPP